MIAAMLSVDAAGDSLARGVVLMVGGAALKASVILLACTLATLFMRRSSAAARHLVWTIGVIAALIVPPLTVVLPAWRIAMPVPALAPEPVDTHTPSMAIIPEQPTAPASFASAVESAPATIHPQPTPNAPSAPSRSWLPLVVMTWLAGALLSLAGLLFSVLRVRR